MKRVFVCIALVALSIGAIAQTKAVRIESPIVSEKDFVWYTEQKEAWKALTQKDPTNETAWLNYELVPAGGFDSQTGGTRDGTDYPQQLHV